MAVYVFLLREVPVFCTCGSLLEGIFCYLHVLTYQMCWTVPTQSSSHLKLLVIFQSLLKISWWLIYLIVYQYFSSLVCIIIFLFWFHQKPTCSDLYALGLWRKQECPKKSITFGKQTKKLSCTRICKPRPWEVMWSVSQHVHQGLYQSEFNIIWSVKW